MALNSDFSPSKSVSQAKQRSLTYPTILPIDPIYPTPPLGQDMTQGQILSGV